MLRSFTLIELIFTIVVIGILAAVAFPRYFGIEQQAQKNVAKAFAGTLYRTVGHSFWAKSLAEKKDGSIKIDNDGDSSKFFGKSLSEYTTIPKYFDQDSVNFDNCAEPGEKASPFIAKKNGVGEYNIFCRDGNSTNAPYFVADKNSTYQF